MSLKKKVIVEISGGLGNQLFCYSSGIAACKEEGLPLFLDISSYDDEAFGREYCLDNFGVTEEVACFNRKTLFGKLIKKIKLMSYFIVKNESDLINAKNKKYKTIYLSQNWNNQNFATFLGFQELIKEKLKYQKEYSKNYLIIKEETNAYSTIAVHIRFGDYVKIGCCIDPSYYLKAFKLLRSRITSEEDKIQVLVFSDDISQTKSVVSQSGCPWKVKYIDKHYALTDVEEFMLMSECDHFIICNSTFSWWSAFLGEKKESIVIAPKIDGWIEGAWGDSFFPKSWQTIDTNLKRL